jgi:hypothetical protein
MHGGLSGTTSDAILRIYSVIPHKSLGNVPNCILSKETYAMITQGYFGSVLISPLFEAAINGVSAEKINKAAISVPHIFLSIFSCSPPPADGSGLLLDFHPIYYKRIDI